MRRFLAPLAIALLATAAIAGCSKTPTTNAGATPTPTKGAASTPSPTPAVVPSGSPCEISKQALDKLKPIQDKYKVAFGSNDAAKANAAKAEVQAGLKAIASDLRAAAAASTANEVDLKEALLQTATKIEAGAADPALFAVSKTEADANKLFNAAALNWIPMTLLASCTGK